MEKIRSLELHLYSLDIKKISIFRKNISLFYGKNGRKYLPWRHTTDPWKILLSEFLLRKTTAAQARQIYEVLKKYNTEEIYELADDYLNNLFRTIGLQNERTRLIKLISGILKDKDKDFYYQFDDLIKIPGIGKYTASAIQCFALNIPYPALDRNMIRILERVFSISSYKKRPHTDNVLWNTAKMLVNPRKPKEYNWGVIDLAAFYCRPKNPKCNLCYCRKICDFNFKFD